MAASIKDISGVVENQVDVTESEGDIVLVQEIRTSDAVREESKPQEKNDRPKNAKRRGEKINVSLLGYSSTITN